MKKEMFFAEMKKQVQELLDVRGINRKVEISKVLKNNDQYLTALRFQTEGSDCSPLIYLDHAYKEYLEGHPFKGLSMELACQMLKASQPKFNLQVLECYETAREHLTFALSSIEKNKEWLADKVWEPMGEFAKVCYVELGMDDYLGFMSTAVNKAMPCFACVTQEQILEDAQKNLDAKKYTLEPVASEHARSINFPMYILTNEISAFGASMIANAKCMVEVGTTLNCDFYVLPVTRDEVWVVPVSAEVSVNQLIELLRGFPGLSETLGDDVLYYERETGNLCVV